MLIIFFVHFQFNDRKKIPFTGGTGKRDCNYTSNQLKTENFILYLTMLLPKLKTMATRVIIL